MIKLGVRRITESAVRATSILEPEAVPFLAMNGVLCVQATFSAKEKARKYASIKPPTEQH